MLNPAWTKLRPVPEQSRLWRSTQRFMAVPAGRGSGKTELARRRVIRMLPVRKPWPDPIYFYALPTRDQAKRVAWQPLKNLVPKHWISEISEGELTITTIFGSKLWLVGLDKPHRVEGVQWDGGIIDESSDQRPGVFDLTFMPAFSHRNAWCWRIGVPKRFGIGASEFKAFYDLGLEGSDPDIGAISWPSSRVVPEEQLASAKRKLADKDYREQYEASWETTSGAIFYAFDEVANVSDQVYYNRDDWLLIGSDFNVDPMCWVIGQEKDGHLHVLDELFIRNTNTRETLDELWKRFGESHNGGFLFYGDATGRARKSSASSSDYLQIKHDPRFHPKRVFYPESNPARIDRYAACNALLCNADYERRCLIHPRCTRLIEDLKGRVFTPGTREPDDSGDMGHMSDGFGYLVYARFPISVSLTSKRRVHVPSISMS